MVDSSPECFDSAMADDSAMAEFQQAYAAAERRWMLEIEEFRNAVDDTGNMLHPRFDELADMMTEIVLHVFAAGKPAPSLQELYATALRAADPSPTKH